MLPSGNDAACLLACYYGFWLTSKPQGPPKPFLKEPIGDKLKHYELYSKRFVQYMNQVAKELEHPQTHFENPHGLSDKNQLSTAKELGEACLKFMKNAVRVGLVSCSRLSAAANSTKAVTSRARTLSSGRTPTSCWGMATRVSKRD
jgi:D-alanyl-D-alanine carboxypeptidase